MVYYSCKQKILYIREGVLFLLKITITIDDTTLHCLRVMREVSGISHSAAIRLAVLSYFQDKFFVSTAKKK